MKIFDWLKRVLASRTYRTVGMTVWPPAYVEAGGLEIRPVGDGRIIVTADGGQFVAILMPGDGRLYVECHSSGNRHGFLCDSPAPLSPPLVTLGPGGDYARDIHTDSIAEVLG